jgi:hypothetical protein
LKHHASTDFWTCYQALPQRVRELADQAYERLKADPRHPSLHFKKAGRFWSVRVGAHHRALEPSKRTTAWSGSGSEATPTTTSYSANPALQRTGFGGR